MQDPYFELQMEKIRVENPILKSFRKDSLNGREFKDDYHNSNKRNSTDIL